MRVGVENSVSVEAGEHESEDGLAPMRADRVFGLGGGRPAHSMYVVCGEDPAGRELGVNPGNAYERVPLVERVELLLVGGLDPVVQLVSYPVAYLLRHHLEVDVGCLRTEQR